MTEVVLAWQRPLNRTMVVHMNPAASELQRDYYKRTAASFEGAHEQGDSAHNRALELLVGILPTLGAQSVLDVGTGTGRALRYLSAMLPELALSGVEPVDELSRQAVERGLPSGMIRTASGENLPFEDGSVDVVTSFGVLHHVASPEKVLKEMLRVARKAVFISDGNRFAQGRPAARYMKLALHAAGLWPAFDWVRTRGRGYMVSEGDGVYFSFSLFDWLPLLRAESKQIMMFELDRAPQSAGFWSGPICNAPSLLLGAIK